jgi:hypothetical protein
VDNCGLSREELKWFTDIARRILSAKRFAENYLYRNLINEFISGLFAMNCNIASKSGAGSRAVSYVFKCGKDMFIDAIIYEEHLYRLNEQLREKLLEAEVEEVSITELRLSHLTLGIFNAAGPTERLVVYYGEPLELLQRNSLQYHLVSIEGIDGGVHFVVIAKEPSKPFNLSHYITKYYFNKEGECAILDDTSWYWFDPKRGYYEVITSELKQLLPEEHINVLNSIYNKRDIIEERLNNAIYLTLKIPSTILLY